MVSLFDAVNPGEDTSGDVGILRVVEACTRVGPTAELVEAGLPVDFKGTPVCVTPPFPSLSRIVVAVARVLDRDVSLATSPPLVLTAVEFETGDKYDPLPPPLVLNCVVEGSKLGVGGGARGLQTIVLDDEVGVMDEDDGVIVTELDIDIEELEE